MRIYSSESNPLDFCKRCFPKSEQKAFDKYGHSGDGPDGRGNCFGYDAEAPWFYDESASSYECECCGVKLTPNNSGSDVKLNLTMGLKESYTFDGDYCEYNLVV